MAVTELIRWSNGNVMAFDSDGKQVPEYQGLFDEIRHKAVDLEGVTWKVGIWGEQVTEVPKKIWFII